MGARLTLGRVSGVFGVRGWVRVQSFTRPAEGLLEYEPWWLAAGAGFETQVMEGRSQGNGLVVRIKGSDGQPIDDRDVAAGLIGAEIQVDRSALPELPQGQWYWADLVGLQVRNLESAVLGQVTSLTSNGAQDVLVVRGKDETERLIPFVTGPIVHSVDLKTGQIVVDWQLDY